MEPRKKPIPNPMARATVTRALSAATSSRALPTIAALLAATSLLACSADSSDIAADQQTMRATLASPVVQSVESTGPIDPLVQPGMGGLEVIEQPSPPDPKELTPPIKKTKSIPSPIPPPVAGGLRPIHPIPVSPALPGKPAPTHPPGTI